MREFWVRCEYFVAPTKKTPIEATHHSLEIWVHESLAGGPGFHAKSKTYVGGDNGTAWRIRVLLKYLASIGGTIPSTNVSAPSPIPVQYDPTRVSVHLWDAVIQWLNMWLSALIQSNIHLASSSNERCAPPGEKGIDDGEKNGEDLEAGGRTDDQEIPSVLSVDVVTPSPGSARRSKRPKPKPKTGPALPPTSEELDGLQQIDTDNVGHDGDSLGSTHAPNTTSRPRRKRKGKTAKQDAAKPPQPAAVTSGEPSQVPAQAAPAPLVVEGVGGLDGVLEAAVRARMALKPAQMATLKAEVIKELEEEGDFWVVERIKPLTKSVGRGEPPKWDKPRCALVENIPRFKNPLNTLDPSTLKPSLLKFIEDSKALIAEYLSMEAEYHLPYGRSCLVGSITRANDSAHCFPLLDQAIWQHGYHYAKCQAWWNGDLGDIFGDFHILYAEGSALLSRIQELAAKGEKCGLNDDILDLAELRTTQVQTYWCHGWKLLGLAKLWVNKHQECWLWSKDTWSLPDKVRLVNDLIAWEIQTTGLLKDLEASSEKDWAEAGYPPMLRPPSSWFLFGNPGPNAVDEAAKAQLIEAMKDLEERRASEEAKNDPPTPPPPIIHSPPTSAEQTQVPQQENKEPHATTVPKDDTLANLPMCLARSEDLAMQEGASQAPMDLDPPPPTLTLRPPEGVVEELGAGKAGGVDGADGPEVAVGHGGGASSAGDAGGEVEAAGAQTKGKGRGKGKATATVASQNAGPRTRKQQAAGVAKEPVRRSARTALPSKR
ncbi:hypothetical protein FS749_001313 [Ceratobasidium sp. UAMH 11750]|nr:hypothetical protein FS749_001313 [Ceratobasidium sp. UAMH 11750]